MKAFLIGLSFTFVMHSGQKELNKQNIIIPSIPLSSNITISGLKAMYSGTLVQITTDTIIQGIIVSSDETGNIYKSLYIQDSTAGLNIAIDKTSIFNDYRLGQRILIKCKGLYLGDYGGVVQLGYNNDGKIGRIPSSMLKDYFFKDSLPGPLPKPILLDITSDLTSKISMLVKIENISFLNVGQPYSLADASTSRVIADSQGNAINIGGNDFVLRTSKYSNFRTSLLPQGIGTIVGILSVYNGIYQINIRDLNDVKFNSDTGSNIKTLISENFDTEPSTWTKFSLASNKNWEWSSKWKAMIINGSGGNEPSNDWLISPTINLSGVKEAVLSFRTWTNFIDDALANPLEVLISADYIGSGNPTTSTWIPLTASLAPANTRTWTSSGDISLATYNKTIYIAFRYLSSGKKNNASSSWEVDTFIITGK